MTAVRTLTRPRPLAGDRSRVARKALGLAAGGLCLAAAPTFALMALVSYLSSGELGMQCTAMSGTSSMSGMTVMYALMGAFHLTPWLRLASAGIASASEGCDGDA